MTFNKDNILKPYRFNLAYAADLVADIIEEQMYHRPSPGLENTPGFTLGHLVTGSHLIALDLGESSELPEGWEEMFQRNGPGDPRLPDFEGKVKPSKSELLDQLEQKHRLVENKINTLSPADFDQPCQWRFSRFFPTDGDMVLFMCVTHEAMHLAQVAAWRRAVGLPSSLGRL